MTALQSALSLFQYKATLERYAITPRPSLRSLIAELSPHQIQQRQTIAVVLIGIGAGIAVLFRQSVTIGAQILALALLILPLLAVSITSGAARARQRAESIDQEGAAALGAVVMPYVALLAAPVVSLGLARVFGPGVIADTLLVAGLFLTLLLIGAVLLTTAILLPAIVVLYLLWLRVRIARALGSFLWKLFVASMFVYAAVGTVYYTLATTEVPSHFKLAWVCAK